MKNNTVLLEKFSKRIIEIDILRGISIFLMIFDHLMYDIFGLLPSILNFPGTGFSYKIYDLAIKYWNWDVRNVLHYVVCFFFLGITGICCSFSKNNLKRGVQLLLISLGLTVVTLTAGLIMKDVDMTIVFGVLHCIATTLIIVGFLEKYATSKYVYLIAGIIMTSIGIVLEIFNEFVSLDSGNVFLIIIESIIGFSGCGSDHFPILLNGGQIFIGVFLGKQFYANKKSLFKNAKYKNNIVTFTGRNSLIVYFAHQIILPVILIIICLICGFKFAF